jgi:CheY-like chemotaxis protein
MLAVSDEGPGIDDELLRVASEPATTKSVGLGLSAVKSIVQQNGGHLLTDDASGQRSIFVVYLPRVDDDLEIDEGADDSQFIGGSETILLVEDEDEVRDLTRRILAANGYEVLEARNGAEVFLVSEEHDGPIQLLLADVIIPFMKGPEVANAQSRTRPEMKVLYMSGYTDEAIARHGVLDKEIAFIPKPFSASALLSKVREVLDSPADQYSLKNSRHRWDICM